MTKVKQLFDKAIKICDKFFLNPLTVVLFFYILSILLIGPWGNFAVNDDFYYLMQVKAFSMGMFTKSALIGPTFILQAFIGLFWGEIFGITYTSLRILTIIVSILSIILIDKTLVVLNVKKNIRTLALLLAAFNPYFYASSLSFMSETYFLFFTLWSLFYFLSFIKTKKNVYLLIASILGGLSMMIRQYGVVLLITYILVYLSANFKKIDPRRILSIMLPFVLLGCLGIFWPKFKSMSNPKSLDLSLFFVKPKHLLERLTSISIVPYIAYFFLPFTIPFFVKLKKYTKGAIVFISLAPAYLIYKSNIFLIGNVFYFEGLYARILPNVRENMLNNIPFKLFAAYFISVSLCTMIYFLLSKLHELVKKIKIKEFIDITGTSDYLYFLTLAVSLIGFYLIVLITDRVYDRYFINLFIVSILFVSLVANRLNFNPKKLSLLVCSLMCVITFLLVFDFYKVNQLKWKLANRISNEMGVDKFKIFLDNVYMRTTYMDLVQNYEGIYSARPDYYNPVCFVQEYTKRNYF